MQTSLKEYKPEVSSLGLIMAGSQAFTGFYPGFFNKETLAAIGCLAYIMGAFLLNMDAWAAKE